MESEPPERAAHCAAMLGCQNVVRAIHSRNSESTTT